MHQRGKFHGNQSQEGMEGDSMVYTEYECLSKKNFPVDLDIDNHSKGSILNNYTKELDIQYSMLNGKWKVYKDNKLQCFFVLYMYKISSSTFLMRIL